ncbi:hypothetical protein BH925_09485 [Rodentibacter pneumotropicus]|nr:response regulator [Rodentibacter pneumotropicus]OOF62814.1 hypothetical protein BH925_09485 [Rodentibacter pneumotropicus]
MPILCESAEQAIEQLEQGEKIDYLLSDIMLSDKLTGIDLAKWIQKNFPAIKILLITGHTAQLENAEQFPVLIKPFTLQSLQQKLLCL